MNTFRSLLALGFLGVLPLIGCEDAGPIKPAVEEMSLEDQLTLELLADPATVQAALDLADTHAGAAYRKGWNGAAGQGQHSQAEMAFRQAQDALAQGDLLRARDRARDGRRLVSESIQLAGGQSAIEGMIERLESLPTSISADPGAFVNSAKLGLQVGQLATMAREAARKGDHTRAGALGVLSEQAFRHQYRNNEQDPSRRAALAVSLGAEAVDLAERILGEQVGGAETEQLEPLATAEEFLSQAALALDAGENQRAGHLAKQAQWWALKAVVLPGGITDEEARFILGVAETLLTDARAAVGAEPTDLEAALLARAARMLERGKSSLENGVCRGIGALWQSAILSSYLLG
jgi:hypothetical protein